MHTLTLLCALVLLLRRLHLREDGLRVDVAQVALADEREEELAVVLLQREAGTAGRADVDGGRHLTPLLRLRNLEPHNTIFNSALSKYNPKSIYWML